MMTQSAGVQVAAIILAAGGSTRMGELKQLLPMVGRPLVWHTTRAVCAAGLAQVVVVLGARARAVQQALVDMAVEFTTNEVWAEGMSTSLRAGIDALRPEIAATLVVLADQPTLSPTLLRALVQRYKDTGAPVVAPFYHGRRGNPVLFDRSVFPELLAIQGDQGGRTLFARYRANLERFETDDEAVLLDVDTPQDYAKLREQQDDIDAKD
jgi:molybdenum cofactor cytidylyltransferase